MRTELRYLLRTFLPRDKLRFDSIDAEFRFVGQRRYDTIDQRYYVVAFEEPAVGVWGGCGLRHRVSDPDFRTSSTQTFTVVT